MDRHYFLQDDDCHWYLIPYDRKKDFHRLLWDEDNSGMEAWERDEWNEFEGYRLDGGIERISFECPVYDE